ncbi:MFS transporter [Mammaliicoccus lentus]|uniref:MFS transporter n=1 Tax=Mammaliicoccus lentus TaxID=42858 RepID=UPI001B32E2AA|nr:MFS transporter [Mammaliicoccus lentus]
MKKNFLFIILFTFFSIIGSKLFTFALSFHVLNITGSVQSFSNIIIIYSVVFILGSTLMGYYIDKINKKLFIISMQCISVISIIGIYVIPNSLNQLIYIYIIVTILTITDIAVTLAFNSGLLTLVSEKYLDKTVSYRNVIQNIIQIGAPVLGGIIYAYFDIKTFTIIMLITELISLLFVLFISFNKLNVENEIEEMKDTFFNSYKTVFNFLKMKKALFIIILSGAIINFMFGFITVGIPGSFVTLFNMNSKQLGLIETAMPIAGIIFGVVYPRIKNKGSLIFNMQCAMIILALGLLILCTPLTIGLTSQLVVIIYFVSMFIMGIGIILSNIPINIYVQKNVPENIKGKYLALHQTMSQIMMPAGILISGILFDIHNYFYLISFLLTTLLSIAIAFSYQYLKRYDGAV